MVSVRMKSWVYAGSAVCALCSIVYLAGLAPAKATSGHTPLTATIHEYLTRNGVRTHIATYEEFHFADGAIARLKRDHSRPNAEGISSLSITSPSGPDYRAVPELRVKSTFFATPEMKTAEKTARPDPAAGCLTTASRRVQMRRGSSVRHGIDVVSIQTGQPGQMMSEAEFAPSLGCYAMYERTEVNSRSGALEQVLEKEVVSIHLGQPSSRFDLKDYEEVAPSEFRRRIATALGMKECPECMEPAAKREDDVYHRLRTMSGAAQTR